MVLLLLLLLSVAYWELVFFGLLKHSIASPAVCSTASCLRCKGTKSKSETMAFPCTSFGATGLGFLFAEIDKKAGKNGVIANVKLTSLRE